MAKQSVKLISKKNIADNVVELRFTKPKGFSYQAGQFVQFYFNDKGKEVPRSYSLSSTSTDDYLEFCVKYLEDGLASMHFQQMNEGDDLLMEGPRGRFVCNENAVHHVFIATGSGIAPIMGMIRDELENKQWTNKIDLLFGIRTQKDIIWAERLAELAATYENLTLHLTLSQPEAGWNGLKGRVTSHLDNYAPDCHFYICGSARMVMDVRKMLRDAGCEQDHLHFEIF